MSTRDEPDRSKNAVRELPVKAGREERLSAQDSHDLYAENELQRRTERTRKMLDRIRQDMI